VPRKEGKHILKVCGKTSANSDQKVPKDSKNSGPTEGSGGGVKEGPMESCKGKRTGRKWGEKSWEGMGDPKR